MHSTYDLRWNRLPVWFHESDAQESDSTHWKETELKLLEHASQFGAECFMGHYSHSI